MVADTTLADGSTRGKALWLKLSVLGAVVLCLLIAVLLHRDKLSTPIPSDSTRAEVELNELPNPVPIDSTRVEVEPPALLAPIPSDCTRVEIEYYPSIWDYFRWYPMSPDIFSSKEMDRLQSHEPFIINDQMLIESVRRTLRPIAVLNGNAGPGDEAKYIEVRCFRGNEPLASLRLYRPDLMVTNDGRRFRVNVWNDGPGSYSLELSPLIHRAMCARNLLLLHRFMFEYMSGRYPPPANWCDVLRKPVRQESVDWRRRRDFPSPSPAAGHFSCSSMRRGKCSYAMNPDCQPSSPPDTVLLFETRDGWNQHGGPELFTFDNHFPRGGSVLLNDGTVKFIRTEEELKQLRWQ